MSKIKNDLRGIGKVLQIFPDISIREIKSANSIIFQSKSAQIFEKIDRKFDKLATAKQSQIISAWRKFLEKHLRSTSENYSAADSLNHSY